MKLSAFVLAAGLGERLAPITNYIPKPLLPVLGKPILESILEKISELPVNKIGINLHHKKELIQEWIKQSRFNSIELFLENPVLGTGGALKNAEEFLKDSIFLIHNSDIYSDIDLRKLIEFHLSSDNIATLAIHNHPKFNNLVIDNNGLLCGSGTTCSLFCKPDSRLAAFTGISVYSPDILKFIPDGASSIVNTWDRVISAGYNISTLDVTGCSWNDIGTPASYTKTIIEELKKNGETLFINTKINSCDKLTLSGYIVIEAPQKILEKFHARQICLKNCIVLPDADFHLTDYQNCIIGPGFKIDLKETEIPELYPDNNSILIGTGGSDRQYFRIIEGEKSLVLMQCKNNDPDFQRHIEYTNFFKKYGVPVPELFRVDFDNKIAYFEDFGDCSLYNWLKCSRNEKEIREMYRKVIDILILIHTAVTEHVSECPILNQRVFDYGYLRWETDYFVENFLAGIMKIKIKNLKALEDEFHRLALKVDSFPKTIIHRDFQAQNIMISSNNSPGIIDYQGARIGPPAYDLASILWDPYYRLEENIRDYLLDYYLGETDSSLSDTVLPCRLQRHMQALGAYGYLATVKDKKYFLKYIPEALRLLKKESALAKDEYPELYRTISAL